MGESKKKKKKESRKKEFSFVTREEWGAVPPIKKVDRLKLPVSNLRYSYSHTKSENCTNFETCCKELQVLQATFIEQDYPDLPYNFLISSDGRVYEGRGWYCDVERHKSYKKLRRNCIDITYLRDLPGGYPTEPMTDAAVRLVKYGIKLNLIKEYPKVESIQDYRDYLYYEDQER